MTGEVRILAVDWERLLRSFPEGDPLRLAREVVDRGLAVIGESADPALAWAADHVQALALMAVHRFDYAAGRERFAKASEMEQETYERELELNRDVVPPLKERAKALRAEIRRLEEEARALGLDPGRIEPRVNWDSTFAVDAYSRPEYESNEARRERTVEFFRRLRPP